ncbi:hypothetical protein GS908_24210 [Rhodococcus hoagii]|nr:hypothetical protein [Prescottella equi]MBM4655698.1 hypothetical protein [Prescottella equi]MBM4718871.1 hypothetical protein [Prescottella equi]MBM4731165.1 hypothetical protein [Prescottella equi]NKR45669.1 hypothetical protein [Prescottella equi]
MPLYDEASLASGIGRAERAGVRSPLGEVGRRPSILVGVGSVVARRTYPARPRW